MTLQTDPGNRASLADSLDISRAHPVVLFDGVCNLCSSWVNFIIDRDPAAKVRFASLQSTIGRELMTASGGHLAEGDPESIVLIEGGRRYERSGAVLRVLRHLSGAWSLFGAFLIIPAPLRDVVYRWIAANRYRWFGRSEVCRVPTPELRSRFLE